MPKNQKSFRGTATSTIEPPSSTVVDAPTLAEPSVVVDATIYMTLIFVSVVLMLHHVNYTHDYLWKISHRFFHPYETGVDQLFQKFSVGGFLLLSGYKLSRSKVSEPAVPFLFNRFKRIYPLYLLALIVSSPAAYPHLVDGQLPSLANFIMHALCLQAVLPNFFQQDFYTIWFVSNLLCCYLLFLGLRKTLGRPATFCMKLGLFIFAIALVRQLAGTYGISAFTNDFNVYLLFFAAGMGCAQLQPRLMTINKLVLIGISVVCTGLLIALTVNPIETASPYGSTALSIVDSSLKIGSILPVHVLLLTSFQKTSVSPKVAVLMNNLTVASYCTFLFHRPIWTSLHGLWSGSSYLQSVFILGFGIPLIFVCSYCLQLFYNRRILPMLPGGRPYKVRRV